MAPEGHLTCWRGAPAAGTGLHAVDINAAGMTGPDCCFAFQVWSWLAVVLLDAEILNGMACSPQGGQQLGSAIEQGLAPLRVAGSHDQNVALKIERPAMGRQLCASQFGPVLPYGRQ